MKRATGRAATYDDANLILKLYDMRREPRLRDARKWFAASFKVKSFDELMTLCPPGSEPNASYRMVTTYWELVASFLTSGVLHEELFYQSGRELLFCWERVRDIVPQVREKYGNPIEWKNLEIAASAYVKWWNAQAPGAYEAFAKRIR
ncbi:MAG TPA: hypothetical protein VIW45_01075 [Vicinamibacterales bacterium]|jgi:hypothetical protein